MYAVKGKPLPQESDGPMSRLKTDYEKSLERGASQKKKNVDLRASHEAPIDSDIQNGVSEAERQDLIKAMQSMPVDTPLFQKPSNARRGHADNVDADSDTVVDVIAPAFTPESHAETPPSKVTTFKPPEHQPINQNKSQGKTETLADDVLSSTMEQPSNDQRAEINPDLIYNLENEPYSTKQLAQLAACGFTRETGILFEIEPVSGGFALRTQDQPQNDVKPANVKLQDKALKSDQEGAGNLSVQENDDDRTLLTTSANKKQLGAATLADFPDNHPVHQHGIEDIKPYMREIIVLRPSYRSMLLYLLASLAGLGFSFVPHLFVDLIFSQADLQSIAKTFPLEYLYKGVGWSWALVSVYCVGYIIVRRLKYRFRITLTWVRSEIGIIARSTSKLLYEDIRNIETHQSIVGRFLNYGHIELASSATAGSEILILGVANPQLLEDIVNYRKDQYQIDKHGPAYNPSRRGYKHD